MKMNSDGTAIDQNQMSNIIKDSALTESQKNNATATMHADGDAELLQYRYELNIWGDFRLRFLCPV